MKKLMLILGCVAILFFGCKKEEKCARCTSSTTGQTFMFCGEPDAVNDWMSSLTNDDITKCNCEYVE